MKKNVFIVMAMFSLVSFTSCSSSEDKHEEVESISVEQEIPEEIKQGVVHRINFLEGNDVQRNVWIRLTDGKILEGTMWEYRMSSGINQPRDFFFAQPGDTIVYSGEKAITVKFKN